MLTDVVVHVALAVAVVNTAMPVELALQPQQVAQTVLLVARLN